jgi:CMP/dCMP kinase
MVAIDGPSASGKSTVARETGRRLELVYVDSGALYRGVTWKAVRSGVDVKDAEAVVALMQAMDWSFFEEDRILKFTIDGVDPADHLRSEPVRERVADVAVIPEVRAEIVARLRAAAEFGGLVMEGRDIGSVVFPDTPFKYYLDADPEERARRRHQELVASEGDSEVETVLSSLNRRDTIDRSRKTAPLQIPLGARVINTTGMTVDEVVDVIVADVRAARECS